DVSSGGIVHVVRGEASERACARVNCFEIVDTEVHVARVWGGPLTAGGHVDQGEDDRAAIEVMPPASYGSPRRSRQGRIESRGGGELANLEEDTEDCGGIRHTIRFAAPPSLVNPGSWRRSASTS